eukprot:GHUV01043745.1.p1 GENE.GHUV01043745.1~~GHUV01043745.1.p1  ORF type:complete len:146 (+),score=6.25 GHUV01043745.1:84-521(+)
MAISRERFIPGLSVDGLMQQNRICRVRAVNHGACQPANKHVLTLYSKFVCTPTLGGASPLVSPPLPQCRWNARAPALAKANSASVVHSVPAMVSLRSLRPPPYLKGIRINITPASDAAFSIHIRWRQIQSMQPCAYCQSCCGRRQ